MNQSIRAVFPNYVYKWCFYTFQKPSVSMVKTHDKKAKPQTGHCFFLVSLPSPFIIMKTVHHQLILVSDSAKDIILLPVLFSGWSVSPLRSGINHSEKWCQLLSHNHHLENANFCSRFALKCCIQRPQAKIHSSNKMCVSERENLHCLKIFSFSNSLSSSPVLHIRAFILGSPRYPPTTHSWRFRSP